MEVVTIKLNGVELRVYGDYSSEEYETNSPEEYNILEVHVEGVDIQCLLTECTLDEIEKEVIKKR